MSQLWFRKEIRFSSHFLLIFGIFSSCFFFSLFPSQFFGLGFQHMKQIGCKIGVLQNWFSNFLCMVHSLMCFLVFFSSFGSHFEHLKSAPIQDKKKLKAAIFSCLTHIYICFTDSFTELSTWSSGCLI